MKRLTVLSVLFLVSSVVVAADYNSGLKKELSTKVTKVKVSKVKVAPPVDETQDSDVLPANIDSPGEVIQPQAQAAGSNVQTTQQPIFILQQPTSTVEAAPVKESRADQLRKQREEVERQNESKLIERLEDERLNSEKERADKIMAPFAKPEVQAPQTQLPAPVIAAPVVETVQVQQEIIPAGPKAQSEELGKDGLIKAAVIADKIEEKKENKFIVGLLGGLGSYPSVGNVSGAFAIGGTAELVFPSRIGVQGTTTYSSYDVNNVNTCPYCSYGTPLVTTMSQWDISGGFNYAIFKSTITPTIGALLDYTRRDYTARVTYGYGNPSFTGSNAFNGGFRAGFDVQASENLIIGGSLTYMMNISYRTDNPLAYGAGGYIYNVGSPIESLSYYMAMINTKFIF